MLSGTALLLRVLLLLLLLFSLPSLDFGSAQDVTMVHSRAFTQQLNLVGSDTSMQQLALTDEDVQYLGITVDEREPALDVCTMAVNVNTYVFMCLCLRKWIYYCREQQVVSTIPEFDFWLCIQ